MPGIRAARAAQKAVQGALESYRSLVRAGTVSEDSAMVRELTRARDNATRDVRAAEAGTTRQAHRREVRGTVRTTGETQYQREERLRAEKIQRESGHPNRYTRDKARIIAQANEWTTYRWATRNPEGDPDLTDAQLAALFVDNFTVGKNLTPRREGQRARFVASVDRWSWRLWRDEYDRHGSGAVRVRYARDTDERLRAGGGIAG